MPSSPVRRIQCHALRPTLYVPARRDPLGETGPTPYEVRGSRWRRTTHGLYLPADLALDQPWQRILEAAQVIKHVASTAVTGWAALSWQGGSWFSGTDGAGDELPIHLVNVDKKLRPQQGYRLSQERLNPVEVLCHDGLAITTPWRSLAYEMRYARSFRHALVYADMAAYSDLVSLAEIEHYTFSHLSGWTGVPQLRMALKHMEENSWSPQESWLRLSWVLAAGLPTPLANPPLFDDMGNHIATPDLLDPDTGLVGEYDGRVHLSEANQERDPIRIERMRDHGLEPVRVVAGETGLNVASRLRTAYARAARTPNRWTLEQPPGWVDTSTVEARRKLTAYERATFLRYRRAS